MRNIIIFISATLLFWSPYSHSFEEAKLRTLYSSLNPLSIPEHLAFYELYPESYEGKQALQDAWALLSEAGNASSTESIIDIPSFSPVIQAIITLVNKQPNEETPNLSNETLIVIERLSENLGHRKLKGHKATREEDVLSLPKEDIDLARGLFLSQLGEESNAIRKIRSYEAMIDLMALQILTKVNFDSLPEEKIKAINHFVFNEMGFRFPPHSIYAKDIDLYTFLPSVLDSRKGVCLGVSILYLCIAQRLNLNLEMITPPGHIYVRYRTPEKIINIETTARGIDIPTEKYLGVETRSLQQRTIKEVIGMAHFNQASTYWQNEQHDKAIHSYEAAKKYMPHDKLLIELLAYNYLFAGQKEKGEELLQEVKGHLPDHAVTKEILAEDYLNGFVGLEGIRALFLQVDETRESILKKKNALQLAVQQHPHFRNGYQALAITWMQLHRTKEALEILKQHHNIDSNNPSVEYYLAILYMQRLDYNQAWEHLRRVEEILKTREHYPKAIQELRRSLTRCCPE